MIDRQVLEHVQVGHCDMHKICQFTAFEQASGLSHDNDQIVKKVFAWTLSIPEFTRPKADRMLTRGTS